VDGGGGGHDPKEAPPPPEARKKNCDGPARGPHPARPAFLERKVGRGGGGGERGGAKGHFHVKGGAATEGRLKQTKIPLRTSD